MKFHCVHGSAISLSDGQTCATRSDSEFCNGIVFSDSSFNTGTKLCIELTCTDAWSGALRVGLTTTDPDQLTSSDLPRYSLPHLAQKDGFWIRPISESLTADGHRLMLYLGSDGNVQLFVNNVHKGALLVGLPTGKPFWLMLDIYGNTKGVKFVKPGQTMFNKSIMNDISVSLLFIPT